MCHVIFEMSTRYSLDVDPVIWQKSELMQLPLQVSTLVDIFLHKQCCTPPVSATERPSEHSPTWSYYIEFKT